MRFTLAIIALIFFVRNALLPLAADDFSYAFVWDGDHVGNILYGVSDTIERVDSIDDLIQSQWSHYETWGGRTPAHTLIQFFIWIGKEYFNVANTLMFVALIFLIARLADVRLSTKNLLWIAFGLWLAVPEWISTMQWLTGACNYLWMGVAQLLFIYLIVRPRSPSPIPNSAFLIPNCLLAGWSNEAGAIAALFVGGFFVVRQKNFSPPVILGLIFFSIGFALMIFAPGNFVRTAHLFPDGFRLTTEILIEHSKIFLEIIGRELILIVPLLFMPSTAKKAAPFLIAALLIPSAMMFSPVFKDYAGFASPIYLLIASTAALNSIDVARFGSASSPIINSIDDWTSSFD